MSDLLDLFKRLNVSMESPYLEEAYKKSLSDTEIPYWLTEEYIYDLNSDFNILPVHLDEVIVALKQVSMDKDLILFAKILYHILSNKIARGSLFMSIELPQKKVDNLEIVGYNFVSLFPLLAHTREACENLLNRGIDKEIVTNTFSSFDACITLSLKKTGIPSFIKTYFLWQNLYINCRILFIDRLEFEIVDTISYPVKAYKNKAGQICQLMNDTVIHRSGHLLGAAGFKDEEGSYEADFFETNEYYEGFAVDNESHLIQSFRTKLLKSQWQPVFLPGDTFLSIHIPTKGKFDTESCIRSYNKAREIFTKYFPEYNFKVFLTNTWLLAPELSKLLKPGANILNFQDQFNIFPSASGGLAVFSFVFNIVSGPLEEIDLDSLPEDTSLMRNIKKHYKDGNYVHEFCGFFPF